MQNVMNLTELLHEKTDKIVVIHCQFYLRVYHIYPYYECTCAQLVDLGAMQSADLI